MQPSRIVIRVGLVLALVFAVNAPNYAGPGRAADAPPTGVPPAGNPDQPLGDATAIEYGLIAALIAVVIIGPLTALGAHLDGEFDTVADEVDTDPNKLAAPPGPAGAGAKTYVHGSLPYTGIHIPGGTTATDAFLTSPYANGGEATVGITADSDFAARTLTLGLQARVLNSTLAADAPDVALRHHLAWTTTLFASDPNNEAGPGEMALVSMEISFSHLLWGIGGPVKGQTGVFEIEGPDGTVYSFTVEHDPAAGMQLTDVTGFDPQGFVIGGLQGPINLQGLTFASQEVLSQVPPAVFTFEIPYNQATDVTFHVRHASHDKVFAAASAVPGTPAPATLAQSVPNPFNPLTGIRFALAERARVEIVCFDARGREVRRLGGTELDAGEHEVSWDGRDDAGRALASGTYLYQLRVGGQPIAVRKAVLVR